MNINTHNKRLFGSKLTDIKVNQAEEKAFKERIIHKNRSPRRTTNEARVRAIIEGMKRDGI